MRIEHVAVWTSQLEALTRFYVRFFAAHAGPPYRSASRPFESCFLSFPAGPRLELMRLPDLSPRDGQRPTVGLAHLAISVGSRSEVDRLTTELSGAGVTVQRAPRVTGDGCYESVVLDPDGNQVEITA